MDLDRRLLVLCIIREADNALPFRAILSRSNLPAGELEKTMGALALDGKIRTFAGDEEKPLEERRFFSAQEARREIEELAEEHLPLLAGEGRLYFVYGAGLDPEMYRRLSPGCHFLMRGCLEGYRLVFDRPSGAEGGVANLRKTPGSEVWGVVYYFDSKPENLSLVDDGGHKVKIRVAVKSALGQVCAETVLLKGQSSAYPSRRYLDRLIRGGHFFGLPQKYLRLLATLPTAD